MINYTLITPSMSSNYHESQPGQVNPTSYWIPGATAILEANLKVVSQGGPIASDAPCVSSRAPRKSHKTYREPTIDDFFVSFEVPKKRR